MLRVKTVTKRQKKEIFKKRTGLNLIFIGLILIAVSLFYTAYLERPPKPISPLSKNQSSTVSIISSELKKDDIDYKSIQTSSDLDYVIKLSDSEEVIVDPKKDIPRQLSSLQLILRQLKIEGKAFKRLDFRFEKPIISF